MKKKFIILILAGTIYIPAGTQAQEKYVNVIPQPQQTTLLDGEFDIGKGAQIICDKALNDVVSIFNKTLSEATGITLPPQKKGKTNGNITLKTTREIKEKEGYTLTITPSGIQIEASCTEGIFYGLQTLQQLIFNSKDTKIPCCKITDSPRFAWRGVLLDVSRTFMPVTLIKRYIDLFATYKLNTLQLHLTDDQGWRVEIKQYPKLTQVGSKFAPEFNCMGGYYTQDDIRDLVRYASLRNITIIPEIEMPGHACAALASYPWLSCTGEKPKIHTFLEGPGIHEEIFCAGKETTYQFLYNVLDEIMDIFPSTYIHIGGDEAPKANWKKCPHCQKAMTGNELKNEEELQSYFVNRIGTHLQKNGRMLVGWNEIMKGGKVTGSNVIMLWHSWKKEEVEKAIKSGSKIVCSPVSHCYFDYGYDATDTHKIHEYEPVKEGAADEAYVIGIQANFWSHNDRSEYNIDKQLFPRLLGLAETAWSSPHKKSWEHFKPVARQNTVKLKTIDDVNVYHDPSLDLGE